MNPEQHWIWILLGALAAAPIWCLFGIILWVKWLYWVVRDGLEDFDREVDRIQERARDK